MTMLDPVDYDMLQVPLDFNLQVPRIIIPDNVLWSDVYYRQNHDALGTLVLANFTGEAIGTYSWEQQPIRGADANFDLTQLGIDHLEVHSWYLGTIRADDSRWRSPSNTIPNSAPLDTDEEITAFERSTWYNTPQVTTNPLSGSHLQGQGGGLQQGWYWSLPGGGGGLRPQVRPGQTQYLYDHHTGVFSRVLPGLSGWNFSDTNFVDLNADPYFFNGNFSYPLSAFSASNLLAPSKLPGYLNTVWPYQWGQSIEAVDGIIRFNEAPNVLTHQQRIYRQDTLVLPIRLSEPILSGSDRPKAARKRHRWESGFSPVGQSTH